MQFGKIISTALRVTWREKKLWVFALVPLFISFIPSFFQPAVPFNSMEAYWSFVILSCGVGLAALLITPIQTGSLTIGLLKAFAGKKVEIVPILRESLTFYWRLLLLPFVGAIPLALIYIVAAFGLRAADQFFLVCLLCAIFLIFLAGVILWTVTLAFAQVTIVQKDLRIVEALSKAWSVVKSNLNHVIASIFVYGACLVAFIVIYFIVVYGFLNAYASVSGESFQRILIVRPLPVQVFTMLLYSAFAVFSIAGYSLLVQTYQVLTTGRSRTTKARKSPRRKKAAKKAATTIKKKRIR
jgi:hypothetical protein